jgi:hypothetical protein
MKSVKSVTPWVVAGLRILGLQIQNNKNAAPMKKASNGTNGFGVLQF